MALWRRVLIGASGLAMAAMPFAAAAHPHIFIDARATIVFDDAGNLAEIRNSWTFDEAFSVWQTQGLDTNNDGVTSSEEMQELADENLVGLAEYGFYTFAGRGTETIEFVETGAARFEFDGSRSTLTFSVAPASPYRISETLEVAINDPEYYVAISFADLSDVTLVNAPAGCATRLDPPQTMSDELAEQLYALPPEVTTLPPELAAALRGVQGAIVITCPPSAGGPVVAETAVDAAASVAEARPAPFGGPPPEPGFAMPRTGFLGWVAEQQRNFYQALTAALGALKQDVNAFWVLGSLSFLYGVFHAAGPGHGKVVISSYVLANERQVRRGVLLSFLSAMLQSGVAVAFVLVLVAALNLTASVMSDAAQWIGVASYLLVMLLGIWLIARKLFGWGHSHGHEDAHGRGPGDPHYGHDHGHDEPHAHDHGHEHHHHAVVPSQTGAGWREQFGVVLAVGLRPCSGALVVLAFALSQGLLAAGIVSVILMGLGTALTVAVLASAAVGLKAFAGGMASANGVIAGRIVWWAELFGAVAVFGFGVILLMASI